MVVLLTLLLPALPEGSSFAQAPASALDDYPRRDVWPETQTDEKPTDEQLTALDGADLMRLAQKSVAWWIEHGPDIRFRRIDSDAIRRWVEALDHHDPDAVALGLMLASAWISRHRPEELPALWYDLATLEIVPREARLILAGMIVEDLRHRPNPRIITR